MASKVYFADFRCPSWRENLQQKLARLMMTAGFGDIDMGGKYVAIKMHFGEPGNMAYLRPNWAKTVADLVKRATGRADICHLFGDTTLEFPETYNYIKEYKKHNPKTLMISSKNKDKN